MPSYAPFTSSTEHVHGPTSPDAAGGANVIRNEGIALSPRRGLASSGGSGVGNTRAGSSPNRCMQPKHTAASAKAFAPQTGHSFMPFPFRRKHSLSQIRPRTAPSPLVSATLPSTRTARAPRMPRGTSHACTGRPLALTRAPRHRVRRRRCRYPASYRTCGYRRRGPTRAPHRQPPLATAPANDRARCTLGGPERPAPVHDARRFPHLRARHHHPPASTFLLHERGPINSTNRHNAPPGILHALPNPREYSIGRTVDHAAHHPRAGIRTHIPAIERQTDFLLEPGRKLEPGPPRNALQFEKRFEGIARAHQITGAYPLRGHLRFRSRTDSAADQDIGYRSGDDEH